MGRKEEFRELNSTVGKAVDLNMNDLILAPGAPYGTSNIPSLNTEYRGVILSIAFDFRFPKTKRKKE